MERGTAAGAKRREEAAALRKRLRDTRAAAGRPDPYYALVSEAMLQQTQVATVLPYFARFVDAFPTVEALAAADEQRVLRLWQGLGYYRRARHLHAAAKAVVAKHGGAVPRTVEALRKLPGVGRYTAGAIASIAHGVAAPILDGNVARVLARFDGIETPVNDTPTLKVLWKRAEQLVQAAPKTAAGDFNQALMELGALVCMPSAGVTKCASCPLRDGCHARATGRVDQLPAKRPKKKPVAVTHTVLAIERRGKLLFEQRPATGLWSNMWQLPTLEMTAEASSGGGGGGSAGAPHAYAGLRPHMTQRFGLTLTAPVFVEAFTHQTTHRTIRFEVFRSRATAGRLKRGSGKWCDAAAMAELPLAKPQTVALAQLDAEVVAAVSGGASGA